MRLNYNRTAIKIFYINTLEIEKNKKDFPLGVYARR